MRNIFTSKKVPRSVAGFTLVELMVSISVFTLVMVISMGAILSVLDANRKSQTLRSAMDNLNFSMDSMTRTIRFGTNYHCGGGRGGGDISQPQDCPSSPESSMTVLDSGGHQVTYALSGGRITRTVDAGATSFVTSPDINITSLSFWVFGSDPADTLQPQAIILVRGTVQSNKAETSTTFTLETTVSQRKFDIVI